MAKKRHWASLASSILISLSSPLAHADLCQYNEFNKEAFARAAAILKENSKDEKIKVYWSTLKDMWPKDPRFEFWSNGDYYTLKNIMPANDFENYQLSVDVEGIGTMALDIGFTYYFSQASKQWQNLGLDANCLYQQDKPLKDVDSGDGELEKIPATLNLPVN